MGAHHHTAGVELEAAPISRRAFAKGLMTLGVFGAAAGGVARIAYADAGNVCSSSEHVAALASETHQTRAEFVQEQQLAGEPKAIDSVAVTQATLDVPCYLQYPELPTGCESVALTNLLRFWDFSLSKTELAVNWVPRSASDFVHSFLGNPFSEEGGCILAPGLTDAANSFLESNGSDLRAYDITGTTMSELLELVEQGEPIIVWTTVGMREPGPVLDVSDGYAMRDGSHAVVLSGFNRDEGTVTVADSLAGVVTRDAWVFQHIYEAMGSQAVAIA